MLDMEAKMKDLLPDRESCVYTQYYCEENVWKLCDYIRHEHPSELDNFYAVFISNHHKAVPLWQQRASSGPRKPVVWDYHVICVYKVEDEALVYDLDTRLPFPVEFNEYVAKAIQPDELMKAEFHRIFRVVPAPIYLEKFASDRSHMLREDQSWYAPPPSYPCINTAGCKNNLQDFINMDPKVGFGYVMNTQDFANYFGCSRDVMIQFLKYSTQEEQEEKSEHELNEQSAGESNGQNLIQNEKG